VLAVVIAVLVLSGCGSTVQGARTASSGLSDAGSGSTGLPADGGSTGATPVGDGATGGEQASAYVPGASAGQSAAAGGVSPAPPGQGPVSARSQSALSGPGVTDKAIQVGIAYATNSSQANAMLGASSEGSDERRYWEPVIKDVNSRGGIAGRRVEPVYFEVDATGAGESQSQAACSQWTEDHHVFAFFGGGDSYLRCAEKAHNVAITTTFSTATAQTFRQYPHYFEASTIRLDRLGGVTVNGLAAQGYFASGAKVGIATWDLPNYKYAVEHDYLPALAALGIKNVQTSYIGAPDSPNGAGATSAAISSTILKWKASVDHVMMLDGPAGVCAGTCLTLLFMQGAESQQYRPLYGLNDTNSPRGGVEKGYFPKSQMHGAKIVTWVDHAPQLDEGYHSNASRDACLRLMTKNNIDTSDTAVRATALAACDLLWFMKAAGERLVGRVLNADTFADAVDHLSQSYASPLVYGTSFSRAQHDGVAFARAARYVDDCNCIQFSGKPYRV
jgi:hypothetical protein